MISPKAVVVLQKLYINTKNATNKPPFPSSSLAKYYAGKSHT